MTDSAFEAWYSEREGFSLRAERLTGPKDELQAAFEAGRAAAIERLMTPSQHMHLEGIRVMLQDMEADDDGERNPPSVLSIYTAMLRAAQTDTEPDIAAIVNKDRSALYSDFSDSPSLKGQERT